MFTKYRHSQLPENFDTKYEKTKYVERNSTYVVNNDNNNKQYDDNNNVDKI